MKRPTYVHEQRVGRIIKVYMWGLPDKSDTTSTITLVYKKNGVPKSKTDGTVMTYKMSEINQGLIPTGELDYDVTYYGRVWVNDVKSKAFKLICNSPKIPYFEPYLPRILDDKYTEEHLKKYFENKNKGLCKSFENSFQVRERVERVFLDYGESYGALVDQMPKRYGMRLLSFTDHTLDVMIENYFNEENAGKSDEEKVEWMNERMSDVINHLDGYISNFHMPTEKEIKDIRGINRDKSPVFTITL